MTSKTNGSGRPKGTGRSTPALGKDQSRTGNKANTAERARKALEMRAARMPFQVIADRLGYSSRGAAYNAVKRELSRIPREAAKELRNVELDSLDNLERRLMTQALNGNLGAVDRVLRIKESRARLAGLYEVQADTGVDEVVVVLKAWRAQLSDAASGDDRK